MYKNLLPVLLLLSLGLVLVPSASASGAKYECSSEREIDVDTFPTESEVIMSNGCKFTDTENEDRYLYLNVGPMVQHASNNSKDKVSVTIDSTVFEEAGLRIDASSLNPVPADLMHIPFLFSMTRSNFSRSENSFSLFYVEGVLPYGSNITLRDNWFSAVSYIFEGGFEGFSLTKASVLVLADNNMKLNSSGDYSECVWHQSSNLSITDDSHVIWSNNTIDVTGSLLWPDMYGLYVEKSTMTLTGGSSLEMRENIMQWKSSNATKKGSINVQILASDALSASGAIVSIEDNTITTVDQTTLRYLWEVKNSGNSSKVTPGFMLYVAGNKYNDIVQSVADVRAKYLSPTELLLTYNGTTSNDKPADSGNNGDSGMTGLNGEDTTNNTSTGVIAPAHTVGVLALALCLLACLY